MQPVFETQPVWHTDYSVFLNGLHAQGIELFALVESVYIYVCSSDESLYIYVCSSDESLY